VAFEPSNEKPGAGPAGRAGGSFTVTVRCARPSPPASQPPSA